MGRAFAVITFAALLCLAACDNTVEPFVASDDESFAIYGYLDSAADTQFVRVSPVIDASGFAYGDTLDAHVVLTNLGTGIRHQLNGASAPLADGRRAYYFYTTAPPADGAAYRLDVFRPGGDTTEAFTRTPGPNQVDVQDPEIGPDDLIVQRIEWIDVGNVRDILVHYRIRSRYSISTVSVAYRSPELSGAKVTTIGLQRDRATVIDRLPGGHTPGDVALLGVSVTAELLSPEWGLGAAPERIFFGSIGDVRKEWTLPDSVVTRLGYRVP